MSDSAGRAALVLFCDDLRRLRQECGLSLEALGSACGLSKTQTGDLLNAKIRRPPDLDVVLAIVEKCASYAAGRDGVSLSLTTDEKYWRKAHAALENSLESSPVPQPKSSDPWVDLVGKHVDDYEVGSQAAVIAQRLATEQRTAARKLKNDPWKDPALAHRVIDHAMDLVAEASAKGNLRLSSNELALVVLTPMLHQVRRLNTAARTTVDPLDLRLTGAADPDRASFERFLRGRQQQRLVARAVQRGLSDRTADSAGIGWWLFHRWLDTRPPDSVAAVPVDDVVEDQQLRRLLAEPLEQLVRLFQLSAGELRDPERHRLPTESGARLGVPCVRVRLIGLLLMVAHSLAIEITSLSSTVVEHLGIPEPVALDDLRDTVRDAEWKSGDADFELWLYAECRHEAILTALIEHVDRTDALLGAVRTLARHDTTLQSLLVLPARASADRVRPAEAGREPLFAVPPARFRLDETRVRELLMGEQLYRDRSLAVRELYQNALDACRYRKARLDYLVRTSGWREDWQGRIEFDQGVDADGRHYLRCRDNGVGMGELELREVFSRAGIRFADRPEFVEEQGEWAEHGIQLHPNSRFGIGVMSYFMLADEIEVTTCRMSRHTGAPGPLLQVLITGPGHLFRIKQAVKHGRKPGTEVKLYLRDGEDAPSCVRTLRALLGIAEFATHAEHEGVLAEWEPFVFQPRERQSWEPDGINAYGRLEPGGATENGQVIWCEYGGALLADGIYVKAKDQSHGLASEHDPRGAVVNLAGSSAPVLTVDRTSVLGDVADRVLRLLAEHTAPLMRAKSTLLSYRWIMDVSRTSPGIADLVATAAGDAGKTLYLADLALDVRRAGVTMLDVFLTETPGLVPPGTAGRLFLSSAAAHLYLWRLMALLEDPLGAASEFPETMPINSRAALPSDAMVMGSWHDDGYNIDTADTKAGLAVEKAIMLGCGFDQIVQRLVDLRLTETGQWTNCSVDSVYTTDAVLLSDDLNSRRRWISTSESVSLGRLIAASVRTQLPLVKVRKRFAEFGFAVELESSPIVPLDSSDLRLMSNGLNSAAPWLTQSVAIPALHVARAAQLGHQSFAAVAARLVDLGFTVSGISTAPDRIDGAPPQVRAALAELTSSMNIRSYSRSQVVRASAKAHCSPAALARHLTDLDIKVHGQENLPGELSENDRVLVNLISLNLSFSMSEVLNISSKLNESTRSVCDRLIDLGFDPKFSVDYIDLIDSVGRRIIKSQGYAIRGDATISLINIAKLAASIGLRTETVARSVRSMGAAIPDIRQLPERIRESDVRLLARDPELMVGDIIPVAIPVPLGHLLRTAHASLLEPRAVAARLHELGYQVPTPDEIPEQFAQQDVRLLSWSTFKTFWQDAYEPVPMGDLIRAAIRCRISLADAAQRMTELGLEVPDLRKELPPLLAKLPKASAPRPPT